MGLNNLGKKLGKVVGKKNTNILDDVVKVIADRTSKTKIDQENVDGVSVVDNEGNKNYTNISPKSDSELGRMLYITYPCSFNTFLGKCASVKNFMTAITVPGFPLKWLTKTKFTREEKSRIFNENTGVKNVPNYWALIAYAFIERVKSDAKLQELLINNTTEFVSIKLTNRKLGDRSIYVSDVDETLYRYIAIVQGVETMLKEGRFNKENIDAFVYDCKYHPETDILEGVAVKLTVKEQPAKEVQSEVKLVSGEDQAPSEDAAAPVSNS